MSAPLRAGFEFAGRYRIDSVIAHGERKWTYLASDMKTGGFRQVALAVLEPGTDPTAWQREVEMMSRIGQHDCIVTLHDFDFDPPEPYLVFEYLPGGRLREHCRDLRGQDAGVSLQEFFRTARQLCRALAHIHGRGVIHGDVSIANIMLDERDVAHLTDFDTAIVAAEAEAAPSAVAADSFAAPEMVNSEIPDHRADLYSLGAVLYEILTGVPPSAGAPDTRVTPPSQLRHGIPWRLDMLIISLLARDRGERPDSAELLLEELRDIEQTADIESQIAGGESTWLEFKQTMRWDTRLQKRNPELLRECVEAVCAFLNSEGGTLLIGVADSGEPTGLEADLQDFSDKPTTDNFELKFRDALTKQSNPDPNQHVMISFPFVKGVQICRADVGQSARPVFLTAKGHAAEFCIRRGNASRSLADISQAFEYFRTHWQS